MKDKREKWENQTLHVEKRNFYTVIKYLITYFIVYSLHDIYDPRGLSLFSQFARGNK